jgi:hypothetical protein
MAFWIKPDKTYICTLVLNDKAKFGDLIVPDYKRKDIGPVVQSSLRLEMPASHLARGETGSSPFRTIKGKILDR